MTTDLAKFDAMRSAIEQAEAFSEVRVIRDQAEALRTYARAAGLGLEAQNRAAELKLRAERKAGEMLSRVVSPNGRGSDLVLLREMGVERYQSSRWQRVAAIPEDYFEEFIATGHAHGIELTTAAALRLAKVTGRQERDEALAGVVVPLPAGRFSTIVADPPWQYGNKATRGAAEDHYATMTIDELCDLPVVDQAAEAAHLYLWTTNGFLREAFTVMDAWQFSYKTVLTWVKPQIGLGNYFRNNTEHVLFGIRGGLGTNANDIPTAFQAARGRHSAKPGSFYDIVEKASPGPYLEMFARSQRFGWDSWGNEALPHVEMTA
jgi:N6-adenosine-specific RNA methylase IME4